MEAIMGIVIAIVVAVIIVAAAAAFFAMDARRRRLRRRFGPEYERLAGERESRRKAEAELTERERRVADLNIRPLSPDARARYRAEWTVIQERFVEAPAEALTGASRLVAAVMRDRGYPTENYDQILADLSVDHSQTLSRFRDAHEISMRADANAASTEDMRQAMINYRSLFQELAGVDEDEDAGRGAVGGGAAGGAAAGGAAAGGAADGGAADGLGAGYEPGERRTDRPRDILVASGEVPEETRAPAAVTAVDDTDPARQAESQQRSPGR
jgi:hypothetical protein